MGMTVADLHQWLWRQVKVTLTLIPGHESGGKDFRLNLSTISMLILRQWVRVPLCSILFFSLFC